MLMMVALRMMELRLLQCRMLVMFEIRCRFRFGGKCK